MDVIILIEEFHIQTRAHGALMPVRTGSEVNVFLSAHAGKDLPECFRTSVDP